VHRLQRLAVVLGLSAILGATLIGWSAYRVSRDNLIEGYFTETLNRARTCAELLASGSTTEVAGPALAKVQRQFDEEKAWDDSYLCVLNQEGRLLLHTRDPAKQGLLVGDRPLVALEVEGNTTKEVTLREMFDILASSSEKPTDSPVHGRAGMCKSLEGEPQMAAFAYVDDLDAMIAIHVPWKSVERRVNGLILPWAFGFGVTVLLAVPLAMWGLSKAFADAERAVERASAAEHRAAGQVRILREIDRAILAGGSVQTIVDAALVRLRALVPYYRASVALFLPEDDTARILAVQGSSAAELGAGTTVPLASLRGAGFDELKAGRASVVPDLDQVPELPDFVKRLRADGVRSMAKIPIASRGELLGTLNLSFDRVGAPADEDLELGREVADVLALAVHQARLQERLVNQAADLERRVAERTRELSEVNLELEGYVHSVSHDLRAPIRAVHGFGHLLLEEVGQKLGKTELEYLERMVSATERIDALMRDLLTYSRLAREDIDVRPLDTQHVIEEAQDLLQVELDERHAVVELVQPMMPVVGHHSSLVHAMTNLLSNAAKFVAPGTHPRIRIRTELRGTNVRVWVEDNGIGIAAAHHKSIFRVFERLNGVEIYPGSGLGLAIVRRAVERMGGAAGVESEYGKGSRFWIDLPAAGARG